MIDNYAKTIELIEKMKAYLPIFCYPTPNLIDSMRQHKTRISLKQGLQINNMLYMGDEGGIGCAITIPESAEVALVASLTHLHIQPNHPLAKEITAYQKKRIKKLSRNR